MPKVSVIIPVYNTEKYLKQCLDSVINQTLKDIEIICVDDGSKDNSLSILKEYTKKDNRIIVFQQENKFAGCARNLGLKYAKGEYVNFIDSDDWIDLNTLEVMYNEATKNNVDIVICGHKTFDDKSKCIINKEKVKAQFLNKIIRPKKYSANLFQISTPTLWTKLFKTSFIKENNIECTNTKSTNDLFFSYKSLYLANSIYCIENCFINYRTNTKTNISSSRSKYITDWTYNISKLKEDLTEKKLFNQYKQTFEKCVFNCGIYELNQFCDKNDSGITILKDFNKTILPKKKYMEFLKACENPHERKPNSFMQNIFSITNSLERTHKIITFFGIKIKIKNYKLKKEQQ